MISQARLKQEVIYDASTGRFSWAYSKQGRRTNWLGTINNFGYLVITINGRRHVAQRLAWLYVYGKFPVGEIDHINRNKLDNRICNLRDVTHSQNLLNSRTRSDNSSGHVGVCWDNQKLKWKVQISVKGGKRLQKHFVSFDDAVNFYRQTARKLFGDEFSNTKAPSGEV